ERLHADIGDAVKAGDVLAQLDNRVEKVKLDLARAQLAEAEARLAGVKAGAGKEEGGRARAGLAGAHAQAQPAKAEAERARKLATSGPISREEFDSIVQRAKVAAQRVEKQRAAVAAVTKGPPKEKIDEAEAAVAIAKAGVEFAQLNLEYTTLRA